MTTKLFMAILIVGFFSILHPAPVEGLNLPDFSGLKTPEILNIDKIRSCPVFNSDFPVSFKQRAEEVARLPFVYIQNSQLADRYRREPVLFGFLTLFTSVALGSLGFIFHLIRHDSRFY